MLGWHHQLNGHKSEQTLGHSEGQARLGCCRPWGCKDLVIGLQRFGHDLVTGQQQ